MLKLKFKLRRINKSWSQKFQAGPWITSTSRPPHKRFTHFLKVFSDLSTEHGIAYIPVMTREDRIANDVAFSDAALIAAAPELFELLERAEGYVRQRAEEGYTMAERDYEKINALLNRIMSVNEVFDDCDDTNTIEEVFECNQRRKPGMRITE